MKCEIKRCRDEGILIYYGFEICQRHWSMACDNKIDLKEYFKIKEE